MQPPVVRAAIMTSLFLAAELFGRQRSSITAIALAAAVMVGINPPVLGTASFQMSFLATSDLIFIYPRLQAPAHKLINARLDKESTAARLVTLVTDGLRVSVTAVLAVWPLIAYYFGIITFLSPLATLLALPVLTPIIVVGLLTGLLGFVALPLAQFVAWLIWPLLSYVLLVARVFAAVPLAYLNITSLSVIIVCLYYVILIAALWLKNRRSAWEPALEEI
jgi:competence protein ComEC